MKSLSFHRRSGVVVTLDLARPANPETTVAKRPSRLRAWFDALPVRVRPCASVSFAKGGAR